MTRTIGYYDDGENRSGTGRYLTELIGALDRQQYQPVFFAPRSRPWHDDLRALNVEIVYSVSTGPHREPARENEASRKAERDAETPHLLQQEAVGLLNRKSKIENRKFQLPPAAAWTAGLWKEVRALRRLFRQRRVDLLHSNNTGTEPAPLAARLAGVPRIVGTFHVLPSYDLDGERSGLRYRLLEKAGMNSLDRAIACCEAAKREWQARCGFRDDLATVIYNGIEVERIARRSSPVEARRSLGLPETGLLIGALGNLHRYKGFETLVRALPRLRAAFPDMQVAVAGTGPLEASLRALAERLHVANSFRLLGHCGDVQTLLDASDLYVQPSLVEACPMAILEAGAAGLPMAASAVGGIPEVVQEGVTGLLVPPSDPDALAAVLVRLLGSPEMRAQMGQAGRCRIRQRFTRERMVAETLAVYEEMLSPQDTLLSL